MKRILPVSFYNPLTLVGSVIAVFNLGLIVFLLIVDFLAKRPRPYSDLIILFILPLFILIGVAFIILGIVRQWRRQRSGLPVEEQRLLVLDFNDQKQRRLVILLSIGFVLLTLLYTFGMFKGYEFVESDFFAAGSATQSWDRSIGLMSFPLTERLILWPTNIKVTLLMLADDLASYFVTGILDLKKVGKLREWLLSSPSFLRSP